MIDKGDRLQNLRHRACTSTRSHRSSGPDTNGGLSIIGTNWLTLDVNPHQAPAAPGHLREVGSRGRTGAVLSPATARLLEHVLTDQPFRPLLMSAEVARHRAEWRTFVAELASSAPSSLEEAERFHEHWHVCHHYLRELVDDEPAVLAMLRVWLPQYAGPDMTLYRGENLDRLEAGRVGIAWTPNIETARIFARGLNAQGKGGAVIRCLVPAAAIVAGPSRHSEHIQEAEFTADPRDLRVQVLERHPPA